MGSQYGLLVLLKIPVLGMSYDTHGIFYIPANFVFNLPKYVTSYMHYSGKKKNKVTICFQGIRTRTLQSIRTETLLSTSIFSKKSIFTAALCRFKYSDWARAEHSNTLFSRMVICPSNLVFEWKVLWNANQTTFSYLNFKRIFTRKRN